jgi:hypothetical protein
MSFENLRQTQLEVGQEFLKIAIIEYDIYIYLVCQLDRANYELSLEVANNGLTDSDPLIKQNALDAEQLVAQKKLDLEDILRDLKIATESLELNRHLGFNKEEDEFLLQSKLLFGSIKKN